MRFLFRIAFWLGVVLVFLPSGGEHTTSNALVSASEAVSAAQATVSDARGFCERQPDACAIGSHAAAAIGHRAQAGAKMLYDYLNERFGADESSARAHRAPDKATTRALPRASGDTLVPSDLTTAWRGPRSRQEARLDRQQ
jgi:hypothetical protein